MSELSRLTLGTAQLGLEYGVANRSGKPKLKAALQLLSSAVRNGINSFDTSPVYGDSEERLGQFLSTSPGELMIVSKLPSLVDCGKLNPSELERQVESLVRYSLEVLGVDQVDYYLIHDENDFLTYGQSLIGALRRCVAQGWLAKIGLSAYSPEVALKAMDVGVGALQIPCNLFDMRWLRSGLLERAKREGVTVFARSVFLQGLLFLPVTEVVSWFPAACPYLQQLSRISKESGCAVAELAFLFVRDMVGVSSLVVGVETEEQLTQNQKLLQAPPLSETLRREIESVFADVPVEILNPSMWPRKQ